MLDFQGRPQPEAALEWAKTMNREDLRRAVTNFKAGAKKAQKGFCWHAAVTFLFWIACFIPERIFGLDKSYGLIFFIAGAVVFVRGARRFNYQTAGRATAEFALRIQDEWDKNGRSQSSK